jgi:hypothetical protein
LEQQTDMSDTATSSAIESRVWRVGQALSRALAELIADLPGPPRQPVELARILRINKDLARKVLLASRAGDPIAATALMPGPEGLRLVLGEARKKARQPVVQSAQSAVDEFDALLREVVGGRAELDALISAWLPETRERLELGHKRALFKAVANLKGAFAKLSLTSAVVVPSSNDPTTCDIAITLGLVRLRRLRPGAPIHRCVGTLGPGQDKERHQTFDGQTVDALRANTCLKEFCSQPTPELTVLQTGHMVRYFVGGDGVGPGCEMDLFFGEVLAGFLRRYKDPNNPRRTAISGIAEVPAKTLIFDLLLHDDVYPNREPELNIYDTTLRGVAEPNDRGRDSDRLDLRESVQFLGRGIRSFRLPEVPRYLELLEHVCRLRGWDPSAFRCHRCRVAYPFYGSQVNMAFDPPLPPDAQEKRARPASR